MRPFLFLFLLVALPIFCEQVEPLMPDAEGAQSFNSSLSQLRERLREKFERALPLSEQGKEESSYRDLLAEIQAIKKEIRALEEEWRRTAVKKSSSE